MSGTWWPPIPPRFEFQFDKEINVEWNVDVNFDIEIKKDVYVDFDVDLDIEGNSTISAFDIEDLRVGVVPDGVIALSNISVEDTSSVIQFQFQTNAYDIIGQSSATGTSVDTFAELTMNLLIPTTGSFHFVATGETAVES
jgi:hypothetical protein